MMLMRRLVRLGDRSHLLVLGANLFLLASIFMLGALPAIAAEAIIVPVHKVKIVKLDRDASVVLVANPTIADVAVESERLIFLFGLEPGETSLTILDADGEEILVAPVVVVPLVERQVTVNRASSNEEATYSCAPRCAAVATPAGTGSDAQKPVRKRARASLKKQPPPPRPLPVATFPVRWRTSERPFQKTRRRPPTPAAVSPHLLSHLESLAEP